MKQMMFYGRVVCLLMLALVVVATGSAQAALFDVSARQEALQEAGYAQAKAACLAEGLALKNMPEPVLGLKRTKAYGTDKSAQDYSWNIMLLSGRALAGDEVAAKALIDILTNWAAAGAFTQTEAVHDAYYAQKRAMMPTLVAFSIVEEQMEEAQRDAVAAWLNHIVPVLDKRFGGDVDSNNHRTSADAVLMLWGAMSDNDALYQKGIEGYAAILEHMENDGTLALETRRGARALWYIRQVLANMTAMQEIAALKGDALAETALDGKSFTTLLDYFLNAVHSPLLVLPDAAENLIPGPSDDFVQQDMGMLKTRGHGRHYMAFAEALLADDRAARKLDDFRLARLQQFVTLQKIADERPLIDEFFGGNATCFFWEPAS